MTNKGQKLTGRGVVSIGRNALFLVSGNTINHFVRFAYMIALAKILGPHLYGTYKYAMSWYLSFLIITGMGFGTIMSREIGRNPERGGEVLSLTFSLETVIVFIAAILCVLIGVAIEDDPQTARLIRILSLALVGRALTHWAQQAFTAYETARISLYLHAFYRPLEVISGLMLLWLGGGVVGVVVLHTISWWMEAVTAIALINKRFVKMRWQIVWNKAKGILSQGLPICLGSLMTYWLSQGSVILFKHTSSAGEGLGQLGLVMTAFSLVTSTVATFGAASMPVLSRSIKRNDQKDSLYIELLLRVIIVFGSAGALFLSVGGSWLTQQIFGAAYLEAGTMLGAMAWISIPWACGIVLWSVFMADGRFLLPTFLLAAGSAVMTISLPPLAARWGAFGALTASGLGIAVWATGFVAVCVRSGKLRFRQAVLRPVAAAASAFAVFETVAPFGPEIALLLTMTVLVLSAIVFRGLTYSELSQFGNFFRAA